MGVRSAETQNTWAMSELFNTLTGMFGILALFALMASGLTMMFSPDAGRRMLRDTLTAIGLFVVASILLQVSCGALRHEVPVPQWRR